MVVPEDEDDNEYDEEEESLLLPRVQMLRGFPDPGRARFVQRVEEKRVRTDEDDEEEEESERSNLPMGFRLSANPWFINKFYRPEAIEGKVFVGQNRE